MSTVTSAPAGTAGTSAPRSRRTARSAAVLGSAAAAAGVWLVAVPGLGVDLRVDMAGRTQPVGISAVVAASVVAGLLGWALLAVLEAHTARAAGLWTGAAVVVALLSLGGPLGAGVSAAAVAVLVTLHGVVAAVLIPVLRRTSRAR